MDTPGFDFNPYAFLPPWAVAALGAGLLAMAVWSYWRTTRPISRRTRWFLLALRSLAILLVCFMLLRPSLTFTSREAVRSSILVLVDRSRSMTELSDVEGGASTRWDVASSIIEDNRDRLDDLDEYYQVHVMHFGREPFSPSAEDPGDVTQRSAYGVSLRDALRDLRDVDPEGNAVEAVILIGDGRNNSGRVTPMSAAVDLASKRVPLYTVGVGQDTAGSLLRDVAVGDVVAPKSTFRFTQVPVRAEVTLLGCQGRQIRVTLTAPNAEDFVPEERLVAVTYSNEVVPVVFNVSFDKEGEYELRVVAETIEGELLAENNMSKAWMKVNDAGVTVGYFDSVRPEGKFLARALLGTENMSMERTLLMTGLPAPQSKEENIDTYDVVILGDLPYTTFRESALLNLVESVQEDGHGLVVLLTDRSGGPQGFQESALRDVLPVNIPTVLSPLPGARSFLAVNPNHPALALAETPQETMDLWRTAPQLSGVLTGAVPKEGAHVVAWDEDGNPLLVVHRSGKGLVAALLADTTFRWTFTSEETQWQHRRFWRQLVMWAAGKEPELEMNVSVDDQRPVLGDDVKVRVSVTDRNGQPMRNAVLATKVVQPDGTEKPVSVAYSLRDDAFVGNFTATQAGDHMVFSQATEGGTPVGEDQAHFTARDLDVEMANPMADHSLMRRMAAATERFGGRYYNYREAATLFDNLEEAAEPVMLVKSRREPLWDTWPLFALLLACMALEWAIRKRKGLI